MSPYFSCSNLCSLKSPIQKVQPLKFPLIITSFFMYFSIILCTSFTFLLETLLNVYDFMCEVKSYEIFIINYIITAIAYKWTHRKYTLIDIFVVMFWTRLEGSLGWTCKIFCLTTINKQIEKVTICVDVTVDKKYIYCVIVTPLVNIYIYIFFSLLFVYYENKS